MQRCSAIYVPSEGYCVLLYRVAAGLAGISCDTMGQGVIVWGTTRKLWYCIRKLTATWCLVLMTYCVFDVGSAC
jgi:hypothetical protein